jgi:hypothetical protein
MEYGNKFIFVIANFGLLSFLSVAAIAGPSTPVTLEKMIQTKTEQQLAEEEKKYFRIVSLAGSKQGELASKMREGASIYKAWQNLKSVVVSHYPSSTDYRVVELAAKTYSHTNKAFIDLQKSILAQNGVPLDTVSINSLIAAAPTASGMK